MRRNIKVFLKRLEFEPVYIGLILILVLRMSLIVISIRFPEGAALIDSRAYMTFASTIIRGATYTDLNSPPGYPFFIALASRWSAPSFVWTVLTQLVLSSITALMLVSIGKMLIDRQAGLIAGWLYALSPNAAFWALMIMSETLYAFLLVAVLWFWLRVKDSDSLFRYFLLGFLLGCGAMVRNIGLIVIPLWVIVTFIHKLRKMSCWKVFKATLSLVIGSSILLAFWATHNFRVHGEFIVTEEHSRTFYVFNVATVLAEVENISRDEAAVEISKAGDPFGITLRLLREHPLIFVQEQGKGILRTMLGVSSGAWARAFGYPIELQGSFQLSKIVLTGDVVQAKQRIESLLGDRRTAILLGLSIVALVQTILLYILGLGNFFVKRVDAWIYVLLITTVALLVISPGSIGQARFRIPAEPYLALLAGVGWVKFRAWISTRGSSYEGEDVS